MKPEVIKLRCGHTVELIGTPFERSEEKRRLRHGCDACREAHEAAERAMGDLGDDPRPRRLYTPERFRERVG